MIYFCKIEKKFIDFNEEFEKFKYILLICGFGLFSCIINLLMRKLWVNVILMNCLVFLVLVFLLIILLYFGLDFGV